MSGGKEQQVTQRHHSRRDILKTIGGTGIAAATLPAQSSAATTDGFLCSLSIPAFFTKEEEPLPPNGVGTVYGSMAANGIWIPNTSDTVGCGWVGNCDGFRSTLPFTLSWTTDADSSVMGEVYANVSIRLPGAGMDTSGWSWVLRDTEELVESEQAAGNLEAQYHKKNVAQNLFRATHIELELDFRDSELYDGTISETAQFSVPNHGLLSGALDLLEVSGDVYNAGVTIADELTNVPLDETRKLTRMWAYSQVSGMEMIDGESLPAQAAVSGISAFEQPIKNRQEKNPFGTGDEAVETLAGPTVVRRSG